MANNRLKSLPPSIENLTNLKELDVTNNALEVNSTASSSVSSFLIFRHLRVMVERPRRSIPADKTDRFAAIAKLRWGELACPNHVAISNNTVLLIKCCDIIVDHRHYHPLPSLPV